MQALGVGAFSAGQGTIHSAYRQRMSETDENGVGIGDVSLSKTLQDGAYYGVEGVILGAITSGVGGAISRPLAKGAAKFEAGNAAYKQKIASFMKHPLTAAVPTVGIEGAVFGLAPYMIEGLPRMEDGTINYDEVAKQWATSTAALSILKGSLASGKQISNKNKRRS